MKYFSIDIETTGLDPVTCQIVEVGAIFDDLNNIKPLDQLSTFHRFIKYNMYAGQPYALSMHPATFLKIAKHEEGDKDFIYPSALGKELAEWIAQYDSEYKTGINAAGKNFASFDRVFLEALPHFKEHVHFRHRSIDPAILFYQREDEKLPGTETCCDRAGIPRDVAHTAIADCLQVIQLVRVGLGYVKKP